MVNFFAFVEYCDYGVISDMLSEPSIEHRYTYNKNKFGTPYPY